VREHKRGEYLASVSSARPRYAVLESGPSLNGVLYRNSLQTLSVTSEVAPINVFYND